MRNQEIIMFELQKKDQRRICVRNIIFLITRLSFCVIFCCFLRLLPPPSQVMYLFSCPIHDISMDGILYDNVMSEKWKM